VIRVTSRYQTTADTAAVTAAAAAAADVQARHSFRTANSVRAVLCARARRFNVKRLVDGSRQHDVRQSSSRQHRRILTDATILTACMQEKH
jgi:3-oxoacyl-ACP reductase-like protein